MHLMASILRDDFSACNKRVRAIDVILEAKCGARRLTIDHHGADPGEVPWEITALRWPIVEIAPILWF